jgi:hypothetical protein
LRLLFFCSTIIEEGVKIGMELLTIEERLIAVENEVVEIKRQLGENGVPTNGNGTHAPLSPEAFPAQKVGGALDAALLKIWRDTPDAAWDKLPADFAENLDHYLYGTPKQ